MATATPFAKMKTAELQEARNQRLSTLDSFSDRVENKGDSDITDVERVTWATTLKEVEEISNIMTDTTSVAGLMHQTALSSVHNDVINVARQIKGFSNSLTVTPQFEKDPKFGFSSDREFLNAVVNTYKAGTAKCENHDPRIKALVTNAVGDDEYARGNWGSAGLLIPEAFITSILSTTPEADFLTPLMTQVPMAVPTVNINARVDKNHSTSVTGGTRVYRTAETRVADKTMDVYEQVKLEATEIVGEAAATAMMMRYSPISISALIESSMKLAAVDKRMDELINGSGNGTPLGFLSPNNLALLQVDRTAGQAGTTIFSGRDIVRMAQRVWGYDSAHWVANWDAYELLSLVVHESPGNAGIVKMFSPMNSGIGATLWGRPIHFTEYAPGITAGQDGSTIAEWNTGLLSCVNMSQYLYGELYTEFNRSVHVRFSEREEVFQFVTSNDARPWWKTVLTPKKGVTTRSPFVTLTNTAV